MKKFNDVINSYNHISNVENYDNLKHWTIKDYPVKVYERGDLDNLTGLNHNKSKLDITVTYVIWDDALYIKYFYLSLLSQILYSDFLRIEKLVIYCSRSLYQPIRKILEPFFSLELDIEFCRLNTSLVVDSKVAKNFYRQNIINKYNLSLKEEFRKTELLFIYDCDSFLYGKKIPIYRKIFEKYKVLNQFPVLGCYEKSDQTFLKRRSELAGMFETDKEYIRWVCKKLDLDIERFVNEFVFWKGWFLTCLFIYTKDHFSFENAEWSEYVEWSNTYGLKCDESVYLTYAFKKNYDISDLSFIDNFKYINSNQFNNFFDKGRYNDLGLVHPLHGKFRKNEKVTELYKLIQQQFKSLVELD